jgi:hypothetical protein
VAAAEDRAARQENDGEHRCRADSERRPREAGARAYGCRCGGDSPAALHWSGKVGLVAGCTPTIDRHHAVMGAMGERFLLFRLPEVESVEQARRALAHAGREPEMRAELSQTVTQLFALPVCKPLARTSDDDGRLISLATLVARARSAVERDVPARPLCGVRRPAAGDGDRARRPARARAVEAEAQEAASGLSGFFGPVFLAKTGSTGTVTSASVRTAPFADKLAVWFVVEAIGATPTVTWKAQFSPDLPEVSDATSVWIDLPYITTASDTLSQAALTRTTVGADAIWLANPQVRFVRKVRLLVSANTNVTFRCEMHQQGKS